MQREQNDIYSTITSKSMTPIDCDTSLGKKKKKRHYRGAKKKKKSYS